jgi:hypothetical protein
MPTHSLQRGSVDFVRLRLQQTSVCRTAVTAVLQRSPSKPQNSSNAHPQARLAQPVVRPDAKMA